ncbi:MAG: hypothetical protein P9X24_11310 [Candidatus Hatepunaea meridiana]|nr:hypothetical protein [Candidatus Hatepunaea meridiana]
MSTREQAADKAKKAAAEVARSLNSKKSQKTFETMSKTREKVYERIDRWSDISQERLQEPFTI